MHLIFSHISTYVLLVQIVCLVLSLRPNGPLYRAASHVVSHTLLLSLFVSAVMVTARECDPPHRMLVVKMSILALVLYRFRSSIYVSTDTIATSIVVVGTYLAFADIDIIYGCKVMRRSLMMSLVLGIVALSAMARLLRS